jgi:hypothetical protein
MKNSKEIISKWVYRYPYKELPVLLSGYIAEGGDENGWSGIYDVFITEDKGEEFSSWFDSMEEAVQDRIASIEFDKTQVELFFKQDMEELEEKLTEEKEKLSKINENL